MTRIVLLLDAAYVDDCGYAHDALAADRYDELMRKDPALRTDEEEAFVEHMGNVLSMEVEE